MVSRHRANRLRIAWIAAALLAGPAGFPGFCTAQTDLSDGLVAHWKLDDPSGNLVADATGNHVGTNHGALLNRPGVLGASARFDQADQAFIDVGENPQLAGRTQATVAALVCPESFNLPDPKNRANSRNGILGDADARFIFALTDGGRPVFVWDAGDRSFQTILAEPADAVAKGIFTHVALTRDGPRMTLYVNGSPCKTADTYAPGPFVSFAAMHLGRVNHSAARGFSGRLDDVRLYDRALSAAEVGLLAQAAKLPKRPFGTGRLDRVLYNNPGLVVDLGVGLWAWPMPIDYDRDGDLDLIVSCRDVPYNGTYFFENPGGNAKHPVFRPGVRIGPGFHNAQVSYVDGKPRLLVPGYEFVDVPGRGLIQRVKLPVAPNVHTPGRKIRANGWKLADFDGDGLVDLLVGVGDWTDYGWDNAFNNKGEWTNGPLHGYVYLLKNRGTAAQPDYGDPVMIEAGGKPIDVYGMPSPCLDDFDGDGDLDLICGEFVDKLTWFENTGTRTAPEYAAGRLLACGGKPLRMSLCMITPVAVDWDGDRDIDLVVGQEDGRVAFVENSGKVADRMPVFEPPRFFQQEAHELKFGALATPVGVDWDADGDDDLLSGNTEGHVGFLENLGGVPPKWAAPKLVEADGVPIRLRAGPRGSIQGPCEAEWGYTTLTVADWDDDGLSDLVVNSIWGKVEWYRNVGTRREPKLAAAGPIDVAWTDTPPKPAWNWWNPEGDALATQWRTTPVAVDFTGDGLVDLVMLDHEGYLALYERRREGGKLILLPPKRVFASDGPSGFSNSHGVTEKEAGLLRLNDGVAGRSGRRKLSLVDWDHDGRLDLLVNSRNVDWLRNEGTRDGRILLKPMGPLATWRLAGHTTSPTTVDWDRNGVPDLLIGAEDGYFYYQRNSPPEDEKER